MIIYSGGHPEDSVDIVELIKVKRTERGWAGHFICAYRCLFRRNTLLEYEDIKIVVSTVGLMASLEEYRRRIGQRLPKPASKFEQIGYDRYYETMAFHSHSEDSRYHDANVGREVRFESPWCINKVDADDRANEMHETVVAEITERLASGDKFEEAGENF